MKTTSSSRALRRGRCHASFVVLTLWACLGSLANPAFALTRWIFDCGDPNGETACYLDFLQNGYFYGRSEG